MKRYENGTFAPKEESGVKLFVGFMVIFTMAYVALFILLPALI